MANPRLFFDSRLADNVLVASGTAPGNYAPANVADLRPYTWWKGDVLPATLTVDCGVPKAADFALIYGHNMKSVGASLEVRGSTDNFVASDVLVAAGAPASDDPYLLTFGSVAYRYWRLRFTGATPPSIAIALLGAVFEFPTGLSQGFDPIGRKVVAQQNRNEHGQPLGNVVDYEEYSSDLLFERVSWDWVRTSFLPAWRSNLRSAPFVFGWETSLYGSELVLVASAPQWTAPHMSGLVTDLTLTVTGVIS